MFTQGTTATPVLGEDCTGITLPLLRAYIHVGVIYNRTKWQPHLLNHTITVLIMLNFSEYELGLP